MQGSYHGGNTASRPISEVKHRWALLVLTWETSLEPNVTLRFFLFSLAYLFFIAQQSRGVCNSIVVRSRSLPQKSARSCLITELPVQLAPLTLNQRTVQRPFSGCIYILCFAFVNAIQLL